MKKTGLAKRLIAIGVLIAIQHAAFAADELLLRAKQMIDSGKAAQAYSLLAPLQSARAGEVEYDYLLALAALDSGKPGEAIFALERVLATSPDNGPARLEIARAYLMLGDTKTARSEFENVRKLRPPEQVNKNIQKYLGAIDKMDSDQRTKVRGHVELSAGRDSNANSATANSQIAIPVFGGVLASLAPGAQSTSDNFLAATAGINVQHALSPEWVLNAGASIGQRKFNQVSQYDIGNIDAVAGITRISGNDQYSGALQYQKIFVDDTSYRQTVGMSGQWQHKLDESSQFTAYGQAMRQYYDGGQQIRDVNRYLLGAAYSQAFDIQFAPVAFLGVYTGKELPRESNVPQLANDFAGVRLGGQLTLFPSATLVANVSHEERRYRGQDQVFLVDRKDSQTDYSLSLNYTPWASWTIRPEISHTRTRSNIVLNDYSRTQYSIAVRHDF